jgi:hypothetical protein
LLGNIILLKIRTYQHLSNDGHHIQRHSTPVLDSFFAFILTSGRSIIVNSSIHRSPSLTHRLSQSLTGSYLLATLYPKLPPALDLTWDTVYT